MFVYFVGRFSTYDRDNDGSSGSCAVTHGAGWWYNNCTGGLPTGEGEVATVDGSRNTSTNAIYWLYDLGAYALLEVDVKVKGV